MKKYVVSSVLVLLVGLVIAVWLLPDARSWGNLKIDQRIPIATLIIGWLALVAALVTILAAIAEVRQVFPQQTVRAFGIFRGPTYQLIVENPRESPIISATRIDVRLVRSSGSPSNFEWSQLPSLKRSSERKANTPPSADQDQDVTAHDRDIPYPGYWMSQSDRFRAVWQTELLEWQFEYENTWFPSSLIQGPEVLLAGEPKEYRWIVTWWTDRQGPKMDVVRL